MSVANEDLTMDAAQLAAYQNKFGTPFTPDPGRFTNYGEGVTGYEGGTTLRNSQYGPHLMTPRDGNFIWQNNDWVPTPEASGSLFGDFIKPIGTFAGLVAGGGALANFMNGAGAAGGLSGAGGAISSEAAALGMGGIDAAGWGSGALDVLGAGSGGGLSWLGNEGLATLPDAVGALPGAGASGGLEGLEPSWFQKLLEPVTNPNQTFAPWANADPSLPFGSEEWLRSAGQGASMLNGQTINLPEWIAANPQAAAAIGAKAPGFFEKLLQSFSDNKSAASSVGKLLGLGDTATGGLNLLSKLLTGIGAAKANRESLATNADRLREAKDTTPLTSSQFNMLHPTALRRAKGGLAQCAECGGGSSASRYVQGGTSGQSDKIPALLSDGEYVFDADAVSALGDGNNAAGAAALDQMRQNIRKHKRSAPPTKIPPKAKKPEQYMKGAK